MSNIQEMDTEQFIRVLDKTPFLNDGVKTHLISEFGIFRDGEDGEVGIEQVVKMLFSLRKILRQIDISATRSLFTQ